MRLFIDRNAQKAWVQAKTAIVTAKGFCSAGSATDCDTQDPKFESKIFLVYTLFARRVLTSLQKLRKHMNTCRSYCTGSCMQHVRAPKVRLYAKHTILHDRAGTLTSYNIILILERLLTSYIQCNIIISHKWWACIHNQFTLEYSTIITCVEL